MSGVKNFEGGVMVKLGFDDDWISLIMSCVCTITYSIIINGLYSVLFNLE